MVASQRTIALLTCSLLLLSTIPAQAGTPTDPEVTDPSGDTYDTFLGMPDTSPGTEQVDITAAWFKEVGQDRYRITIEVNDLTEPGQFRLGKNINMWRAEFTTQGQDFNAFIIRNADGETRGALSLFDHTDGEGAPRTEDGTASVEIDAAENRVSLTLPREWSVETAEAGTLTFTFDDGTELTDIVIRSYDGTGNGLDCFFCVQMDDTDPVDSVFTFGDGNQGGGNDGNDDHGHGNDEGGCDKSNPSPQNPCILDPTVQIDMFCVQFPPPEQVRIC